MAYFENIVLLVILVWVRFLEQYGLVRCDMFISLYEYRSG